MRKGLLSLILCSAIAFIGCSDSAPTEEFQQSTGFYPMYNGTPDTSEAHKAVVAILLKFGGSQGAFCTGTLIHPQYVLTAAHCINGEVYDYRPYLYVGVGNNETIALKNAVKVSQFYSHSGYSGGSSTSKNDIAVLKLASPINNVKPIPPFPPGLAQQYLSNSAMSKTPLKTEFSGFGKTEKNTTGVKLKFSRNIDYYCGKYNTPSSSGAGCVIKNSPNYACYYDDYTQTTYSCTPTVSNLDIPFGSIYYKQADGGPCSGDSGGPAFVTVNGQEYVLGITSYGDPICDAYGVSTASVDFWDFILKTAKVPLTEICDNGVDDNGNGLIDCSDSDCANDSGCMLPESNCSNGKDDNGDGRIDCNDPTCAENIVCQPEICDNGKDDNGNGLIDCKEPACVSTSACKLPETSCDNGIDDNGDGLTDCNDPTCEGNVVCRPEICNNNIDDNANGKADCDDPACSSEIQCRQEICDNNADDNGNGLIDCNDPQCAAATHCVAEICDNHIDDNGNGLIDCSDPQCSFNQVCQSEICNNEVDDNLNGLVDCYDPQCFGTIFCQVEDCFNGIDDNLDGKIDCEDDLCIFMPVCQPELCYDKIDNNGNGLIDCADPQCTGDVSCSPEVCNNGLDDNNDGIVDCADPNCVSSDYCVSMKQAEQLADSLMTALGCSASPATSASPKLLVLLAFLIPLLFRRRKES